MLTEDEMREYISIAENDEWDPDRWKVVSRKGLDDTTPFLISVSNEQIPKLEERARESGKTTSEYLASLVGAMLATA